jgi:hypothetical protein
MTTGTLRKEGTQVGKAVVDDTQGDLLENILIELKILNLHMAVLNGEEITEEDI